MVNRTFQLGDRQLDLDLWTKLYYKHQKEYQRQRLWAIKYLYEGQPPYSPNFNLAEYIIHLLRLQLLHHLTIGVNIQQVREKLETYFQNSQLQTPEQIQKTIRHICALVR